MLFRSEKWHVYFASTENKDWPPSAPRFAQETVPQLLIGVPADQETVPQLLMGVPADQETVPQLLMGVPADQQHQLPGSPLEMPNPRSAVNKILRGHRCTMTSHKLCSRNTQVYRFQTWPGNRQPAPAGPYVPLGKHCHFS